jgi:hypothetical protein
VVSAAITAEENLKLDESCISNPKAEISNWTVKGHRVGESNLKFRLSDFEMQDVQFQISYPH